MSGFSTAWVSGTSRILFEDYWSPQREAALWPACGLSTTRPWRASATELPEHLARNARELRGRRVG